MDLSSFCFRFRSLADREDANVGKLCDTKNGFVPMRELQNLNDADIRSISMSRAGDVYGEVLSSFLLCVRAVFKANFATQLDLMSKSLQIWVNLYSETESTSFWMLPLMVYLSASARRIATRADTSEKQTAATRHSYVKRLVDVHRDLFQKLKEPTKRAGLLWICCELLRGYYRMSQAPQCTFLLTSISQTLSTSGFSPMDVPKSVCVTFYFFWGKHLVLDDNLVDADEKLSWAFYHCPPKCHNARKILKYLVPCRLRLGIVPTMDLLQLYDLYEFVGIVRGLKEGNLSLFTETLSNFSAEFLTLGTFLCIRKAKRMVIRNLCKAVHREVHQDAEEIDSSAKLDMGYFEQILCWQGHFDPAETANMVSELMQQGAIQGYMSHEHRKIVFAKDDPFPPLSKWRMS